jgi:hypothetical protein
MSTSSHPTHSKSSEATESAQIPAKKAAWKKPRVQRLQVTLDTAFGTGSNIDMGRPMP